MKTTRTFAGFILLALGLAAGDCKVSASSLWKSIKDPTVATQLKSFVGEKTAQADASTNATIPEFARFFAAAKNGDWGAVSNTFIDLRNHAGQYEHTQTTDERLRGTKWQDILEIWGAFYAFGQGDQKYSALYANDIIQSIPSGSIYFGGTDAGRFLITAMQKSQVHADPFFTLTQNALADSTYLDYLRSMYGSQIYIPTAEDSQNCFNEYYEDVQQRMKDGKLQPGENASVDPASGKMQVTGQVAVMNISGLIVKVIFDRETNRDFYIEESFPFQWMYPYLEPHGLIFKFNHQPLDKLSEDTVQRDHDYWTKTITPMIGDWLDDDTSVSDVAAFNEKVFLHHDFSGFTGDTNFVLNTDAHRVFSKERSSSAGMFAWRANHTDDPSEKNRMRRAADFAFRQSWALCPDSPEAVFRYVQFLVDGNRTADALLVAETAAKFPDANGAPNESIQQLVTQLKKYQQRAK
jgi:hypothetical protein